MEGGARCIADCGKGDTGQDESGRKKKK